MKEDEGCNCAEQAQDALQKDEGNTILELVPTINLKKGRLKVFPVLSTKKKNPKSRKKKMFIFPSFCCFCGKKLPE